MCGRFSYWDSTHIQSQYNCSTDINIEAHYNACPHTYIPVICPTFKHAHQDTDTIDHNVLHTTLVCMRWGLIPDWAKSDQHQGFINARSETIHIKKSFKENFLLRRCIIPARGYYEWDKKKTPHYISSKNESLSFAGIWDGGNSGIFPSVAILTTQSRRLSYIHERCPVLLRTTEDIAHWLNPKTSPKQLLDIIAHSSDDNISAYKVNKRVNNPRENDELLLQQSLY